MNKQSYFTIGALVIAILVIGVIGFTVREPVVNVEPTVIPMGAISGPDITSPYLSVNGVQFWPYSSSLNTASSTLCDFVTPAATSTLISGSLQITTGTTTAVQYEIGKGSLPTATTTSLGTFKQSTSAIKFTMMASTTPAELSGGNIDPATVFGPSQHLVFKYGPAHSLTTNTTKNVFVGSCKALFIVNTY